MNSKPKKRLEQWSVEEWEAWCAESIRSTYLLKAFPDMTGKEVARLGKKEVTTALKNVGMRSAISKATYQILVDLNKVSKPKIPVAPKSENLSSRRLKSGAKIKRDDSFEEKFYSVDEIVQVRGATDKEWTRGIVVKGGIKPVVRQQSDFDSCILIWTDIRRVESERSFLKSERRDSFSSVVSVSTKSKKEKKPNIKKKKPRASVRQETKNIVFEPGPLGIKFYGNAIIDIIPDSLAQRKGILIGWVILQVNDKEVSNENRSVQEAIKKTNSNKESTTILFRVSESRLVMIQPGYIGFLFDGNIIKKIIPNCQADKKGVKVGWVIQEVNGVKQDDDQSRVEQAIKKTHQNNLPTFMLFKVTTTMSPDDKLSILRRAQWPNGGVSIKNREWHLKTYSQCFIGRELVDWLIREKIAVNREMAVNIGQELKKDNFIQHVTGEHNFRDEGLFYRFWSSDRRDGLVRCATTSIGANLDVNSFRDMDLRRTKSADESYYTNRNLPRAIHKNQWVKDAVYCSNDECKVKFKTLTVIKHHCNMCGNIYCAKCTKDRVLLLYPDKSEKVGKVCKDCCAYKALIGGLHIRKRNSLINFRTSTTTTSFTMKY